MWEKHEAEARLFEHVSLHQPATVNGVKVVAPRRCGLGTPVPSIAIFSSLSSQRLICGAPPPPILLVVSVSLFMYPCSSRGSSCQSMCYVARRARLQTTGQVSGTRGEEVGGGCSRGCEIQQTESTRQRTAFPFFSRPASAHREAPD